MKSNSQVFLSWFFDILSIYVGVKNASLTECNNEVQEI